MPSRAQIAWSFAAIALAALPVAWLWDFAIDDALISVRYAMHVAGGQGYRFNVEGASTDGVTPLPWPFVLAVLAKGAASPLVVLGRAKVLGAGAWLVAAGAWGSAIGRADARGWAKACALAMIAVCVPVAAHAVSGMETGLVISMATAAALLYERPLRAAAVAGACAAFRPEMAPWAVVLAFGLARAKREPVLRVVHACVLASAPFVACGIVRELVFGRAAPLSVLAKPSDLAHGFSYAVVACVASAAPLAVFSPRALFRERGPAAAIALAGLAHVLAVIFAGGDWMPYARLLAPIAPGLLYAFVLASSRAHVVSTLARTALGLAGGLYVAVVAGPAGRRVGAEYRALIDRARPALADAHRVAALDIGWPTAASDADIVDLAGLTDPFIAALPGGHTSKRIDASFLLARDPDAILLFAVAPPKSLEAWRDADFARVVEVRLASSDVLAEKYEARAFLPFGEKGAGYVLLRRISN